MSDSTQKKSQLQAPVRQVAEDAGYKLLNAAKLMTILSEFDEGRGRVSGDLVGFLARIVEDGARQIVRISAEPGNWAERARRK